MRIWFKIYTDTHLMRDITIENDSDDTRTHKIFKALEDACLAFDLGKPIWLDSNVSDFKRHGKTRFTKDNFVEDIDCLLYTSDAADEEDSVDLGGCRIIKKKNK